MLLFQELLAPILQRLATFIVSKNDKSPLTWRPAGLLRKTWENLAVVSRLAVRCDVQAFALVFFIDSQANRDIYHLVGDK